MIHFKRMILCTILVFTMLFCFAACHDPNEDVLVHQAVLTSAEEVEALDQYPNLQTLDLTGSTCYDAIASYIASHPQVAVTYDVSLGQNSFSSEISELQFAHGEYDYDKLLSNLKYLPNVKTITLTDTELTASEIDTIQTAYPNIAVDYSVNILGQSVSSDVTELNLSDMDSSEIEQVAGRLSLLKNLTKVELMDENGMSSMTKADVKTLMENAPNIFFHYEFDLFGQKISTADERVEYVKVEIGNEGIAEIREALDILPNCTYFKLDRCGIDHELMVQLHDDYPDKKIVWRVYFSFCNCLTDVEMIHCTGGLTDENVEVLKYCTDLLYLDIGHNSELSNLSFVSHMPKLKIAIVVDCAATTLEPFSNCPDLEWLEIVNCANITDLSPLSNLTNLKGLNMSAAYGIKDLSPLYGLKNLERLYLGQNRFTSEQHKEVAEQLPNTWITFHAASSSGVSYNYAIGWRLDREGVRAEWYKEIREIFRYSEGYYNHDD